ncbi:PepSY domain-containing protein [Rhodobacter sp. Har01]|uniref:PepSY domain-containing protein n=1 Tax=Rhodobacter sp. Har01 TaxID=2883999 RepID=UPI001D07DB28|nr:PepSY domain-containing protein [Rhodobacter sp. Har01]MCB6176620.1 PepSY domain-containing protein [Rhodobacter sp. Har01]
MTDSFRLPFVLAALVALAQAPAAQAHEAHCTVPMAEWQPREAVQALADQKGLTVRRIKIDDGCYEVDAVDASGQRVRLRLDPATLAVLRSGHGRHGDDDDDEDDEGSEDQDD